MNRIGYRYWVQAVIAVTLISALSPSAHAGLGENAASTEQDRTKIRAASASTVQNGSYSIVQMQTPEGTKINEYVNTAGVVFAVTWDGPFIPDLRQLLGRYFDPVQAAARKEGSTRTHASVETADVIMHSSGHTRSFHGQAYVPQLVPAGVAIDALPSSTL